MSKGVLIIWLLSPCYLFAKINYETFHIQRPFNNLLCAMFLAGTGEVSHFGDITQGSF